IAFLLENLRDVNLDRGAGHARRVVICRVRVTQTGQHVCDRVGHRHGLMALLTAVSLRTCGVVGGRRWRPGRSWAGCAPGRVVGRLPTGLGDAGQLTAVGHGPETDPAQPEPAVHRPRAPAPRAPGVAAHLELRLAVRLDDECLLRHWSVLLERESE